MEKVIMISPPPASFEAIWGDGRLVKEFNYEVAPGIDINRTTGAGGFGEDFKMNTGEYKGKTLKWLYDNHPEYFGTNEERRWEIIPVAMGVAYACADLSVQVHPTEEWSMKNLGTHGKSECWYFVDCPKNANVVMGHNAKTMEELDDYIARKDWEGLIKRYPIEPGSFYAIKAGTLHAIQKDSYFIEICNPNPVTYRFYDYDRLDRDGKPRYVDIDKAKENILIPFNEIKYERKITNYGGVKETCLADNEDYSAWLYNVKGEGTVEVKKPFGGCYVIEGNGTVEGLDIKAGESFFITREGRNITITGDMTILCCHG